MDDTKNDKINRVLGIYTKLNNGCLINKSKIAKTMELMRRQSKERMIIGDRRES